MDKFFRTNSSILEERLDPSFYQPSLVSNDELIKSKGWVELNTFYRSSGIGNTSGVERYYSDSADSIPYISGKAIKSFNIDFDGCQRVTADSHKNELAKSTLKSGDVLVIRKGDMGNACVVPSDVHEANCSSEVIYLKMKDSSEPYFLVSYLNCEQGQKAFKRLGRGTIIPGVSLLDVPFLPVPQFSETAQKYIGDKVRQAEQLRAWAKRLEDSVYRYHSQFIPDQDHLDFNKKTRMVSVKRMTERLDAHFYPGVVEQYLIAHPGKFSNVGTITSVIYNGQTQPESSEDYCEQITVAHLSASFVKGQPRKVKSPAKNDKFVKLHDILMCNAAHNKSYIGRDLTYVHTDKKLLPSTEVMTIRVDRDVVPASYVRAYLLSRLGYVKIQSTIRGITAHSYPNDVALLDIYIPEIEPNQKEEWFNQDELLVQAGFAVEFAQLLTSSAKTLVEALIEGQLTEQQLIQAQQALDDGDNSLDQAILSKLSNEGYAIDGATPLFSDIDELNSLLESATQAEAEE
ncbi:hypothetical protein VT25_09210 [Photobacterium leiognathi subsp. mandapamensis]|nr:hypothetical protein VT25_09210 [Photobacterium leiognathi subsp. mandapamensis]